MKFSSFCHFGMPLLFIKQGRGWISEGTWVREPAPGYRQSSIYGRMERMLLYLVRQSCIGKGLSIGWTESLEKHFSAGWDGHTYYTYWNRWRSMSYFESSHLSLHFCSSSPSNAKNTSFFWTYYSQSFLPHHLSCPLRLVYLLAWSTSVLKVGSEPHTSNISRRA